MSIVVCYLFNLLHCFINLQETLKLKAGDSNGHLRIGRTLDQFW